MCDMHIHTHTHQHVYMSVRYSATLISCGTALSTLLYGRCVVTTGGHEHEQHERI